MTSIPQSIDSHTLFCLALDKVRTWKMGPFHLFKTGLAQPELNGVYAMDRESVGFKPHLDKVHAYFSDKGLPFSFWLANKPEQKEVILELAKRYKLAETLPGMYSELNHLPRQQVLPPGFSIETVESQEQLHIYAQILAEIYGFPIDYGRLLSDVAKPYEVINLLGKFEADYVATGSILLGPNEACIWNMSTQPEYRQRGFFRALMAALATKARQSGLKIAVWHAFDDAINIYQKWGAKTLESFPIYVSD